MSVREKQGEVFHKVIGKEKRKEKQGIDGAREKWGRMTSKRLGLMEKMQDGRLFGMGNGETGTLFPSSLPISRIMIGRNYTRFFVDMDL